MGRQRKKSTGRRDSPSKDAVVRPIVPLIGDLAEFRDALTSEVDAGKKASSSNAIPLSNGKRLSSAGGGFQYQFDIESQLDLPGDAPGELRVPNLDPVPVSVIALEGLSIVIDSKVDLGSYIPVAMLQSDLSMLLLKLIERIETKSTTTNPAGDRLLGKSTPSGDSESISNVSLQLEARDALNEQQLKAVGSVLGRDTTYIWGPPGTGKTHTIGAIGAELFRRGQSLLVVSHTNTAVDGAVLRIAEAVRRFAPGELEKGSVIRIGTPKDGRFLAEENKVLLLSTQRERRARELTEKKDALTAERLELQARLHELDLLIHLHDWLIEAVPDTEMMKSSFAGLQQLREQIGLTRTRLTEAESAIGPLRASAHDAETSLWAKANESSCSARCLTLTEQEQAFRAKLADAETRSTALEADVVTAQRIQPLREELGRLPTPAECQRQLNASVQTETALGEQLNRNTQTLADAERLLAETTAVNWITRKWKSLPDPEVQTVAVSQCRDAVTHTTSKLQQATTTRQQAAATKITVDRLTAELAPHASIPAPSLATRLAADASRAKETLRRDLAKAEGQAATASLQLQAMRDTLASFRAKHGCEPEIVIEQAGEQERYVASLEEELARHLKDERERIGALEAALAPCLRLLHELKLIETPPEPLAEKVAVLEAGISKARDRASSLPRADAVAQREAAIARLQTIATELQSIEELLRKIDDAVIRDARIVGATLTASYLREPIQTRRFDTVLLDEASMAPIPALWIAASVCDRSVVVVGDFRQLPPVVLSQDKVAAKWLGRDPFKLVDLTHDGPKPGWFVGLEEQRRMHPDISAIANSLIYKCLSDHPDMISREQERISWLSPDWNHDEPVLLVDTEHLHAWVTSISRGGGSSSRLNFMSATMCADIVHRMLAKDRAAWDPTADPRILIISPYRPHAKLTTLLLQDDGLGKEVIAGTVHSFQGSQADVVILDLVNDEPHWKVGQFAAQYDETNKRLLNVAVTRAKRRLIVVGDFPYCQSKGKKAFLGGELLPYLRERHRIVNALDVVPAGIAGRAAAARGQVYGGPVEPAHERTVVRQNQFYPALATDLNAAQARVVIYSPFITEGRLADMETSLKAAVERGVTVVVVTKPMEDREKRERPQYRELERALATWNVKLIHKRGMHEKLVLIDTSVVWTGSLNPLSFRNTQEIMERRQSPKVFEEYAKALMLEELLAEFGSGTPKCPVCGGEITAAEGTRLPFYWRCASETCGFSRSVDDDSIKDGEIRCKKCGSGVDILEKDKDGRARWVCVENDRHKQLIKPMHLRLPKMCSRFSTAKIKRLEKRFAAEAKQRRKKTDASLFE